MATAIATRNPKKYTAPVDFEELYREYNQFVIATLVKLGIDQQDALDSAHNLMIRFVEKGGLTWYDEKKLWTIGLVGTKKVTLKPGEPVPEGFVKTGERTAAFMGMFKAWLGLSALGERDKIQNRKRREVPAITLGGPGERDQGFAGTAQFGDYLSANSSEMGSSGRLPLAQEVALRTSLDAAQQDLIRRETAEKVVGSSKDLAKLFSEIEKMMEENGKLDRKELAVRMGVSAAELARQIVRLREFLSTRGLSPKEIAA